MQKEFFKVVGMEVHRYTHTATAGAMHFYLYPATHDIIVLIEGSDIPPYLYANEMDAIKDALTIAERWLEYYKARLTDLAKKKK